MNTTPSNLISIITSQWTISDNLRPQLERYYLLQWSRKYAMLQIQGHAQIIRHQGVDYLARFLDTPNPILLDTDQVLLSFRKLPNHNNGIVLIKSTTKQWTWKEQFPSGVRS